MTLSPAVDPGPRVSADAWRAWARPALTIAAVAVPAGALALLHPAASLIVLVPAAAVAWRLHGSGMEPWRPHRPDRFPNTATDPSLRAYARDLRWRWEHGMELAGLAEVGTDGSYRGPVLTSVAQRDGAVIAACRVDDEAAVAAMAAHRDVLAAGLEAESVAVDQTGPGSVELTIGLREAGEGWT
ncbi:hypothetical protein QQX10_09730 [Demequina sp. SYSU T00039]|uniref:Type VII secretion protein EccE n=1 Tax=Demequina lignilytica TaxID=3051663 RepID=A0AAW7M1S2_9MICO|nr:MULTISPECIES: hypothetical protein [unclassified Demequina]MDN4478101.1 hypothetical protein [Demequina sp. SYSU T00039-1]MDN4488449.1 hypothetical protein [Demequina sp. SYSU T00039]MDN4490004.1 hypothetical protein [Demequina sp. SYSU T00068]